MTNLDTLIIAIYLIITIFVGIFAGRNVKTVSEFAVGQKNFITLTLIISIFATYVDGEMILNDSMQFFQAGTGYFLATLAAPISMVLYALIAPKIAKYNKAISVGDIIGKMYGNNAQIFTGISGFLTSTAFVATQFKALSLVFEYFYAVHPYHGVIISAIILITYSTFGGVKAVTWTDIIQFFILICAVPLVTSVALSKLGGVFGLIEQLPESKLTWFPQDRELSSKYLVFFVAVGIPLCTPPMIQRMLMTKDMNQSVNAYYISALICLPLLIIVCISGLAAYQLNPDTDPSNVFLYLIDSGMPVGLKGFAVTGLIAVIMSTADSFMNSAAVSFSHDFFKSFIGKSLSEEGELLATKVVTFIIGILGCFMAFRFDNLLDIMLYSYALWGPVVTVPLLAGLFNVKADKKCFFIAMFPGVFTLFIWNVFDLEAKTTIQELLPALFVNALFFFGSNWYIKKRLKQQKLTNTKRF